MQENICKNCRSEFISADEDLLFYARLEVPAPSLCPECRQLRRISHINQLQLFKRSCDATRRPIISNQPPYVDYPVYDQAYWYSDEVDNTRFGRSFDFTRPFFPQFIELSRQVPRPALFTDYLRDENSAYTNYAGKDKNCYLLFDSDENWDCLYSYGLNSCKNTVDCYRGDKLELCYEAVDSAACYNCTFIQNCFNCSDSSHLRNCIGVKNSLFCVNVRQKSGYLFNEPASEHELENTRKLLRDKDSFTELLRRFDALAHSLPDKMSDGTHNENCTGNYLSHCKNASFCFDCRDVWDGRYIYQAFMPVRDVMDCNEIGGGELLYECSNLGYNAYYCRFSLNCLEQISHLTYCDMCFHGCRDLFGCVGLKRKTFCILNREYPEREYRALVTKLVRHMVETGEWGEFFPLRSSHFRYNHSLAQNFFPLERNEAAALKLSWYEPEEHLSREASTTKGANVNSCRTCGKEFLLTREELSFYSELKLAHPDVCFFCRHQRRLTQRAKRVLVQSPCDCCGAVGLGKLRSPGKPLYCDACFDASAL